MWASLAFERYLGRLDQIGSEVERMAIMPGQNYSTTITTGGLDHDVSVDCSTMPEEWTGTCAAYYKKLIDDLREAFPNVGGQ